MIFRPGLHLSVLSDCGILLAEQLNQTEDQNMNILMSSPVSDPFWSSSPHLVSFKAAADCEVQQVSLVISLINQECIQQLNYF